MFNFESGKNRVKPGPEKTEERTDKEQQLAAGDEIYQDGILYEVIDILPPINPELHAEFLQKKMSRELAEEATEDDWTRQVTAERHLAEKAGARRVKAMHREGGVQIFTEDEVVKVTPKNREEIMKLKAEDDLKYSGNI